MSNDDKSLAHTRWNCKYHIVFPEVSTKSDLWKVKNKYWSDIKKIV